ncbi:YraN family protein [Fodinibius sp.]|uniref:YraN family protein n=1 Tax=Fodinibius sp. TaxID=1872440 RepID=UPI002ACDC6FF|nr:YraN family protein [Fodinibius sp.]MDZ7659981.1 YraN family protein [Fodinibius sp.]
MSKKTTREIGDEGEELAAAYLESKGYTILERNYHFERAEVDIVAYDNETCIVFAEVKTRSSNTFGEPEEFVDEEKIQNVYKAAEAWIYERKMDGAPVRFDIVSILQKNNEAPDIKHFENAFTQGR